MTAYKVVVLPGDGIGPEVVREAKKILLTSSEIFGFDLEFVEIPCGKDYLKKTGLEWPENAFEICRDEADCILLGAVGPHKKRPLDKPNEGSSMLFGLRFGLDLYANVRPVRLYPNVLHRISHEFKQVWEPDNIDFVVIRENTEGLYSPARGVVSRAENVEMAVDNRIITRKGAERVIRFAFELSKLRDGTPKDGKKKVTCVDKSNVLQGCLLFRKVYDEVASNYPDIERDYAYVDAFTQWILRKPECYDVAVMPNIFGDIITDLAAVLQGGMGMAASGNIGDEHAMFEPVHGSSPKHANKDIVNPIAAILSVHMMLRWLGAKKKQEKLILASRSIEKAVASVLSEGKTLTYDLGGDAKCSELGNAISAKIKESKVM
ncbi:MAG: isocitrate/isopropylmalate dehydrogenase family protein [Thermoplasmata archaeon]|nr:MAG: isocitrate/isopropylmalate dehydrogenase family protein [Thermoplasmata archaeon]